MTTALASRQGALNPLKAADPADILNRVLNEESTIEIANSFGVTRSALNQWLLLNAEQDWRTVQVLRALKRKDEADEEIERATDALSLARAREKLRSAQWDLERVCRRIYGQDTPQNVAALTINIGIARQQKHVNSTEQAQVIDVEQIATDTESVGGQK